MIAFTRSAKRRIGRAHQLLVVLDEIDAGLDQLAHHRRPSRAGRRPSAGLTMVPMIGRPSTPVSRRLPATPNCGPGWAPRNCSRQLHVDDADAGQALDRIDAADGDRHQRREIGADGVERKVDVDIGAIERPGLIGLGKRTAMRVGQMPDAEHPRRHARLQLLASRRARRRMCRSTGRWRSWPRGPLDAAGCFDAIGEADRGHRAPSRRMIRNAAWASHRQSGIMSISICKQIGEPEPRICVREARNRGPLVIAPCDETRPDHPAQTFRRSI